MSRRQLLKGNKQKTDCASHWQRLTGLDKFDRPVPAQRTHFRGDVQYLTRLGVFFLIQGECREPDLLEPLPFVSATRDMERRNQHPPLFRSIVRRLGGLGSRSIQW